MPVSVRMNHAIADGYLIANVFRLLEQEKMSMQNTLLEALQRKKLYEKIITGMVVFLIFYLLVFDLPHPKYGLTTAIANLFR